MTARRLLIAFLMAAFLATSLTYLLYRRMQASNHRPSSTQIVAAAADLPVGVSLTAKDLTLVDWPSDLPLDGSFTAANDVVGRPLITAVGRHEPILGRTLGVQGSGIGLSGKIPNGMRGTAVRSNEIVGVAGFLYPGSRVDVLATYNLSNRPTNESALTQTILQNVEVLTAGQTIEPDPQGKPQTVNVVTLLLTPEDSQKILLASAQGSIQFVLRSGADEEKVQLTPTKMDQLIATEKKPVMPAPRPRQIAKAVPVAEPSSHVMEVILGTQRTENKVQ